MDVSVPLDVGASVAVVFFHIMREPKVGHFFRTSSKQLRHIAILFITGAVGCSETKQKFGAVCLGRMHTNLLLPDWLAPVCLESS